MKDLKHLKSIAKIYLYGDEKIADKFLKTLDVNALNIIKNIIWLKTSKTIDLISQDRSYIIASSIMEYISNEING